jgi:hypothetical protein
MFATKPTPGIRRKRRAEPRSAGILAALLLFSAGIAAGQSDSATWNAVGRTLQSAPAAAPGYTRYNFPRRDITLHVGDAVVSPSLALGSWAGFAGTRDSAVAMGDLVLLAAELPDVLRQLRQSGLAVSAIHNHLAGESPTISYVHFHGEGTAPTLAAAVDAALRRTATPRPVVASVPAPLTVDTEKVFQTLGLRGRAAGAVAQISTVLVPGPVTLQGKPLVPALAYGSPINVQSVSADRMVATGDFAVLEERVAGLVAALADHGITATAMHSHLVGESPRIYYIHFWADGKPMDVLAGLRAALDAAGAKP